MKDHPEKGKALVQKGADSAADSLLASIEPDLQWIAGAIQRDPSLSMASIGNFNLTLALCVKTLAEKIREKRLPNEDEHRCIQAVLSVSRRMGAERDDALEPKAVAERLCALVREEMSLEN